MCRPQELRTLTALRFAAALLVFAAHARRILALDLPPAEIGYVGVSFFFVLSGFVLTWSRRARETAGTFYRHRFARIWPATTLVTLLAILIGSAHQSLPLDLLLLHTWREGTMNGVAANPPSWSLGTEAFFYALFPVLAWWLPRVRNLAALALIVALAAIVATVLASGLLDTRQVYRLPPLRLAEFVIGAAAATAFLRGWRPKLGMATGVAGLAALYAAGLLAWRHGVTMQYVSLLIAPGFALLVIAAAARDLRGAATPEWALTLGRWSFAFYLLHWLVLFEIRQSPLEGPLAILLALAVTLGLSALLYSWFERPVERFLRARGRPRRLEPVTAHA